MTASALDEQQIAAWRRDGFLHAPNLLDRDIAAKLDSWIAELAASDHAEILQHHEMTDAGPQLARTENFATLHSGLGALVREGRVLAAGAELADEPIVLYKEKVNYKLPGGAGFAPHQDATAYKFVDTHLTCMIAIDDATVENGCLELAAGQHGELLPDNGDGCLTSEIEAQLEWKFVEMAAGDVLWFHSRTPHRSGPNRSAGPRRALFLTYNAASEGDLRSAYYADKIARLQNLADGEHARVSTIGHFQGREVSDNETPSGVN